MVHVRLLSAAAAAAAEHESISKLLSSVSLQACSENILVIADLGSSARGVNRQLVRCALYRTDGGARIGDDIFRVICGAGSSSSSASATVFVCTGPLLSALRGGAADDDKCANLVFNDGDAEHCSPEMVLKVERCYTLPVAARVALTSEGEGSPSAVPTGLLRCCDLQRLLLGQTVRCEGGSEAYVYLKGSLLRASAVGGGASSLMTVDGSSQLVLRRREPYSASGLQAIFPFGRAGLAAVYGGHALSARLRAAFASSGSALTRTFLLEGPSPEDAAALLSAACDGSAELVTVSAGQLLAEGGPHPHMLLARTAQYCAAMSPALLFVEDLDALLPDPGGEHDDAGALDMAAALCSVLRGFNGADCGPVALVAFTRGGGVSLPALKALFRAHVDVERPSARMRRQVAVALLGEVGDAFWSDNIDSSSTCALARELRLRASRAPAGMGAAAVTTASLPSDFCAAVAGLAEVKTQLYEAVVWPRTHPQLFREYGVRPDIGVLLFGPPGTGKTLLPRVLAAELACALLHMRLSDVVRGEVGSGERRVADTFREAKVPPLPTARFTLLRH